MNKTKFFAKARTKIQINHLKKRGQNGVMKMNYFILLIMAVTTSKSIVTGVPTETKDLLEDASKRVGESFSSNSENTDSNFISFEPPRSVKDFLNIWVNGLALTGLRVGFHPYKYYNQIFGDPPKVSARKQSL